jgi:hypothetical protein
MMAVTAILIEKTIAGRESQETWRQNEMTDGKPPVVK